MTTAQTTAEATSTLSVDVPTDEWYAGRIQALLDEHLLPSGNVPRSARMDVKMIEALLPYGSAKRLLNDISEAGRANDDVAYRAALARATSMRDENMRGDIIRVTFTWTSDDHDAERDHNPNWRWAEAAQMRLARAQHKQDNQAATTSPAPPTTKGTA